VAVLGRGFHVDDIRFVFHSSLPLSLANYIQETGRAGRDGKTSYAYLFYRAQDHTSVQKIRTDKAFGNQTIINTTRTENEEMMHYCSQGDLCRYSILDSHVTGPVSCESEIQMCHKHARCDICESSRYHEVDFTLSLTAFLLEFETSTSPPNNMLGQPHIDSLLKHVLHRSVADSPTLSLLL
jgi:superfamily II DNA helicase RecQ